MSRRGRNEGSIYQRSDGRWAGAISCGWQNGKLRRKTFYGKTRREVQKRLTAALREMQDGIVPSDDRLTLKAYLHRWMSEVVRQTARPKTIVSYEQLIRLHIVPELGHIALTKLNVSDVQQFLNRKSKSGLSGRTVEYLRAVLRSALNRAVRWSLISRNVVTLTDAPRGKSNLSIRAFSVEEAKAFLSEAKSDRLFALFSIGLGIGLRVGEALGLRWEDIDLEGRTVAVTQSVQRIGGKLTICELKTDRSRRVVKLPAFAVTALRGHRTRQLEERFSAGSAWTDSGLVFTTANGTPMDARNVLRSFHRVLRKAGISRRRFHDLRHSFATILMAQGVSARTVMELLGHSDVRLTLQTYSHVLPQLADEAAASLDAALSTPR